MRHQFVDDDRCAHQYPLNQRRCTVRKRGRADIIDTLIIVEESACIRRVKPGQPGIRQHSGKAAVVGQPQIRRDKKCNRRCNRNHQHHHQGKVLGAVALAHRAVKPADGVQNQVVQLDKQAAEFHNQPRNRAHTALSFPALRLHGHERKKSFQFIKCIGCFAFDAAISARECPRRNAAVLQFRQ